MSALDTEMLDISIGKRRLITDLNWHVRGGECWFVLGKNGVGKSSLLHALAGLLRPAAGKIAIDGVDIDTIPASALARKRGLMPQQQIDAFSHTVLDTVLIGRTPYRLGHGWDSEQDRVFASSALESVGLADRAQADVLQLSGGERQRVALATLLAQAPELLLLDEPTAHQDAAQQLAMMALIKKLTQDHAVVVNCHDINLATRFASHVLILTPEGHWLGPVKDVLNVGVLQKAFGCNFEASQAKTGVNYFAY